MNQAPPVTTDLLQETAVRFWEAIPPFWHQVRAHIRQVASESFGISVEQFQILRHVHQGVASVSELAEVKHISRPAISQAVELLVQDGLILRRQSTQDRRFVQLELTEKGELLLKGIFDNTHQWLVDKFSLLSEGELTDLHQGFEAIKKFVEAEL